MDDINSETALHLLKIALGITHTARDTYFLSILKSCRSEMEKSGIPIDVSDVEDIMLLTDFAEWRYKNRDTEKIMPEHLRLRLNNKKVRGRASV